MNDLAGLTKFATRYAEAWCSQNPASVAAFFAENGSLSVNDGPPAVGRAAIVEIARGFMRDFPDMIVTFNKLEPQSNVITFRILDRVERESAFELAVTSFGRSTTTDSS